MSMDHIVRRGSGSCRWGSIEMVGKSSIWRERESTGGCEENFPWLCTLFPLTVRI